MSVQVAYQYDLFISYADADRPWVEGYLADALRQAGLRWCADAPPNGGTQDLAASALRESRRAILVLSPAYLAERLPVAVALLAGVYGTGAATWPVSPPDPPAGDAAAVAAHAPAPGCARRPPVAAPRQSPLRRA